jgi:S-DNA-T family DNA segregation ATPase FtsK/SpoIIIE
MLPQLDLFNAVKKKKVSQENISRNADTIEQTLKSFGIKAEVVDVLIGPSVTQYALDLALGIKVSKITNLTNNLALALATQSIRLETPIPGTSYIGIEVPNTDRETVFLKEAMQELLVYQEKMLLPMAIGKDIHGKMIIVDLQKMPHMLVAGATGSGKSILTNGFIVSLLMTRTPDQVKFIMVDPKQVELSDYNGIPHLLTPVITEMDKVLNTLKWAIAEMETRYTLFREAKVKNIEGYNQMMGYAALPYIVVVIDEMADMMMSTNRVETEAGIVRLAQKARATGIHLLLATQRPSVDVITGLIKANIPGRIGMSVTTNVDSRVILDQIGAEALLGRGDMLFKDPAKQKPFRIQGIWVSPEEIQKIVRFVKEQVEEVEYHTEITQFAAKESTTLKDGEAISITDEEFANAVRVIVNAQKGSSSLLQRKLKIGYNKAARYIDEMEELGVVSEANGSKPREVLITDAEAFLSRINGANEAPSDTNIADQAEEIVPEGSDEEEDM